jgi:ABC-type branched-chain amino acid transport systems, ATPase component
VLRLEAVRSGYDRRPVIFGMDLELPNGESLALLGRNGVGKTTLLKTIIGVLPLTGGSLTLDGAAIDRLKPHERARAGIAYVPQGRDIFSGLTVVENLKVPALALFGRGWEDRVARILDEFPQLAEKRHLPGESLSGGQQQILALARALIAEPRILLLDEPSDGIQPSVLEEIAGMIRRAKAQRGLSVLIAEQNLEFAASLADRALIIERGRVTAHVNTGELQASRDLQRQYLAV